MLKLHLHNIIFISGRWDVHNYWRNTKFGGSVLLISADNLGSQATGGFKVHPTTFRNAVFVLVVGRWYQY